MKLSISNIAWAAEKDTEIYSYLQQNNFKGLEIAPTRIFPIAPYENLSEAKKWAEILYNKYGLSISSMQSIWYGHTERIFLNKEERRFLVNYTKKAIDFAEVIGCKNLVFGNPKNRDTDDYMSAVPIAIDFFKEIGDYACEHNTIVALEPNPIIYNTHFMNYTNQAVEIAYKSFSEGIKVNVDLGTIIYNEEDINYLKQVSEYINHVHISEPELKLIKKRDLHKQLFSILKEINYNHFVSIEMGYNDDIEKVKQTVNYIRLLNQQFYVNC